MNEKPIRILLADDDNDDCTFFAKALNEIPLAATLTIVHDGDELMKYLSENTARPPDILFLDLSMPRKTGFECLAEIKNLKSGTYALAIYQDVNSSGKIDKNIIGIPTERYAFSNNYKPTVKAPCFNDCKFDYTATNNSVAMKMIQ